MAEVVLSPLIQLILVRLASMANEQFQLVKGVAKEIEKLTATSKRIEAVLADAEERMVMENSVQLWLKELKDVAYDADDILDEFATKSLLLPPVIGCFSSPLLCYNQVKHRHNIANKIKKLRKRIDEILNEGCKLRLREGTVHMKRRTEDRLPSDSFVIESLIYGRAEDKSNIIQMLLDDCDLSDPCVVSIVGMGGLGKTSLAKLVYNDAGVAGHFELKMWVCVSDDFDVKRLIEAMIELITESNKRCVYLEMETLKRHFREKINGKRYLLVLDDVWNEEHEQWGAVHSALSCGAKGSKVLVTTRSYKAAKIMGTYQYYLKGISPGDCWTLFQKHAFTNGTEETYSNLVPIGKEIVRKCGGVPLAVKALGSLMFFKREENDWLSVRDSEIWTLHLASPDCIIPVLRLSYNHLPSHLKQCFAYCSIFPKDFWLEKETLILLWAAEGFIQSSDEVRSLRDIGNEYFNELLWRSFFHYIEKDEYGNIKYCKMHDLIHDLAQSIAGEECFLLKLGNKTGISKRARRLSLFIDDGEAAFPMVLLEPNKIRAFFFRSSLHFPVEDLNRVLLHCKCLRALTISETCMIELPYSICSLIHLRYLDIEDTQVKKLPKAITNLRKLQTLKLGISFVELPEDMSNFKNLMHLGIKLWDQLIKMPINIGQLIFLRTLPKFIVGTDSGCGIGELHCLDLCGSIKIYNLENVSNNNEARKANLKGKHNLRKVKFFWSNHSLDDHVQMKKGIGGEVIGRLQPQKRIEEVLEGLQPHPNVQRLSIYNYFGDQFPKWLMDSFLPNLTHVKLYDCPSCEHLPPFAKLPFLEILKLRNMDSVKVLELDYHNDMSGEGYPRLKRLFLRGMNCLEKFSNVVGKDVMPCLEELLIETCPNLTSLPCFSSVSDLKLKNSNNAILNSIASLTSLSMLKIDCFYELESFSEGMLRHHSTLQCLEIRDLHKLRSLSSELEKVTSLKSLWISRCNNLASLSSITMAGLTCLQILKIEDCQTLECLPSGMQHLSSIKELIIRRLPQLIALPEEVQQLASLEHLSIGGCDRFTFLPEWLGNLRQLKELILGNFSHITSLPVSLSNVSTLTYLTIVNCPHLEKRYNRSSGVDWHMISHIPNVFIQAEG